MVARSGTPSLSLFICGASLVSVSTCCWFFEFTLLMIFTLFFPIIGPLLGFFLCFPIMICSSIGLLLGPFLVSLGLFLFVKNVPPELLTSRDPILQKTNTLIGLLGYFFTTQVGLTFYPYISMFHFIEWVFLSHAGCCCLFAPFFTLLSCFCPVCYAVICPITAIWNCMDFFCCSLFLLCGLEKCCCENHFFVVYAYLTNGTKKGKLKKIRKSGVVVPVKTSERGKQILLEASSSSTTKQPKSNKNENEEGEIMIVPRELEIQDCELHQNVKIIKVDDDDDVVFSHDDEEEKKERKINRMDVDGNTIEDDEGNCMKENCDEKEVIGEKDDFEKIQQHLSALESEKELFFDDEGEKEEEQELV